MYLDDIRDFCLRLGEVNEGFPFDNRTLVFKNPGGMFCLLDIEWEEKTLNLKCDPDRAIALREEFPEQIRPGWHMNKVHWNTIDADRLPDHLIRDMIQHSYDLVLKKGFRKRKNQK